MSKLDIVQDTKDFMDYMRIALIDHEENKESLSDYTLGEAWDLTTQEIKHRLDKILLEGPDEMEKQCIHIANYCMFLWLKLREEKK